ncbi:MAG: nucleoside deaminase [Clostridia bacterium]|nr:nucleoside deaminase [Clostridia bacterium]
MKHEDYMRLALAEAHAAARIGEMPVGAVCVRQDGTILARAHNLRESQKDPTAHAEILCLRQAAQAAGQWRLNDCTLYVTLEPCPMCAGALLLSRISLCVYGAADPLRGCCGSVYDLPMDPMLQGQTAWIPGILEKECTDILQDFFRERRE